METDANRVQEWIMEQLHKLQAINPDIEDVHFATNHRAKSERFTAWCELKGQYSGSHKFCWGDTLGEALGQLLTECQEYQDCRETREKCCVDGCSEKWVVTTGDGNMCAQHGMQWLASEKQAAEENRPPA